jgi:hypothetical protein
LQVARNCNHFANELSLCLVGRRIPSFVNRPANVGRRVLKFFQGPVKVMRHSGEKTREPVIRVRATWPRPAHATPRCARAKQLECSTLKRGVHNALMTP